MNTNNITGRLGRLEDRAKQMYPETETQPNKPCICGWGKQRFYFKVDGWTDEQNETLIDGSNRKHCPNCGGLNPEVIVDSEDVLLER